MQINPIQSVFIQNKAQKPAKTQVWAQNSASDCLKYHEIPAIAFKGANRIIQLPEAVQFCKNAGFKVYLTEITSKINKKNIDAFLAFDKAASLQNQNYYRIFDNEGKMLGECSTYFSELIIDKKSYTKLTDFYNAERETYSGAGSKLLQTAVEKSLLTEDCGRIKLFAFNLENDKNDPFIFYYKKGLSVISPQGEVPKTEEYLEKASAKYGLSVNKILRYAEKLSGKKYSKLNADEQLFSIYKAVSEETGLNLDEIRLNFGETMYLKDDGVKNFWLPIIKKNPILCDANKL